MRLGLKAAILQSGQTQRQLARAADVAESRFSGIVNGWVEPTDAERGRIAKLLNQPAHVLFDPNSSIEVRGGVR